MEHNFKVGDRVISKSKYSLHHTGRVYKIYEHGVSVIFDSCQMFQVFRFKPYHHKQSSISELELYNPEQ